MREWSLWLRLSSRWTRLRTGARRGRTASLARSRECGVEGVGGGSWFLVVGEGSLGCSKLSLFLDLRGREGEMKWSWFMTEILLGECLHGLRSGGRADKPSAVATARPELRLPACLHGRCLPPHHVPTLLLSFCLLDQA